MAASHHWLWLAPQSSGPHCQARPQQLPALRLGVWESDAQAWPEKGLTLTASGASEVEPRGAGPVLPEGPTGAWCQHVALPHTHFTPTAIVPKSRPCNGPQGGPQRLAERSPGPASGATARLAATGTTWPPCSMATVPPSSSRLIREAVFRTGATVARSVAGVLETPPGMGVPRGGGDRQRQG